MLLKALVSSALIASAVLPAAPAGAAVGGSATIDMGPAPITVGDSRTGTISVANMNTPPNGTEANTVTSIRLAPSCGAAGVAANICPTPDPGVFAIGATATGLAGTACAGVTFGVSAPDGSGAVTFTSQSGAVVLSSPGGNPGGDRCTLNFSYNVIKMPGIDGDVSPGVQTRSNLEVAQQGMVSGLMPTTRVSVLLTVSRALPGLVTQASRSGTAIRDTATLTGPAVAVQPTGLVTFQVFGPNNPTCGGAPVMQSTNPSSNGVATSTPFTVIQRGTYRYIASYPGDASYLPVTGVCNDPSETITVALGSVVADFNGDGRSDKSIYRPSTGEWYVLGGAPATTTFGVSSDIPVPGDYDGNATTDKAVFRPSTGQWYILGQSTVTFGDPTDIPVPADYDGNGTTDKAVFRPSTGTWYVLGQGSIVYGINGDIPVPGDYDGNGTTDRAVFRPGNGTWYVLGQGTTAYGVSGDVPVPGDYDGNATTDRAIYRPSTGEWWVLGGSPPTTTYGTSTDIALLLPNAIGRFFF